MRIISLRPYFLDENDTEHEFDNGNLRQYNLIVNVLERVFNLPNLADDIDEEDGIFSFTLGDDNINIVNTVNNANNIPADAGLRLMFDVDRIVQRRNAQNVNRQEGGRKRQRSNKKKRRTYRKKTNKRRKRFTRK